MIRFLKYIKYIAIFFSLSFLTGCVQTMDGTEVAHLYRSLPKWLGGGFVEKVNPGNIVFYNPCWTTIYTVDTRQRTVTWAGKGQGDNPGVNDTLNTRAADGNETMLNFTVQYHYSALSIDAIILNLGDEEGAAEETVEAFARSLIRIHLNKLLTEQFYDNNRRYKRTEEATVALNQALAPFGIIIDNINLDSHEFSPEYQELIDLAKKSVQKAQEAFNQIETVKSEQKEEYQKMVGTTNKMIQDALGVEQQMKDSGDAYHEQKENEAAAIRAEGENVAAVIEEKIVALKRVGGENVVRLAIGSELLKAEAPFYVINRGDGGQGGGMDFSRLDYTEALRQLGAMSLAGENPGGGQRQLQLGK
jgi:hypothetical protein